MSAQQPDDVYTHGHHESVVRAHAARTAENSAAFVLAHLTRGTDVLEDRVALDTLEEIVAKRQAMRVGGDVDAGKGEEV